MNKDAIISAISIGIAFVLSIILTLVISSKEELQHEVSVAQEAEHKAALKHEQCMTDKAKASMKLVRCLEGVPTKEAYKDCCVRCMEQIVSATRSLSGER